MQCLDYVDFNALSVGVGVWVDFYVIVLVCWILDFDFRWYLRAVAKPSANAYRDIMEKSVFLPTVMRYGPSKTRVYIDRYLSYVKERPEECAKYMYYRDSKYFTWTSGDYMEVVIKT
jgi:hypothetical protein